MSCLFGEGTEERCVNKVQQGEKFCSTHLFLLTDMNVNLTLEEIFVEHLDVDRHKIVDNATIIEDLGAGSLDTVELIMAFEEEFDLEMPDNVAELIQTVGDAKKLLLKKMRARKQYRITREAMNYPSIREKIKENRKNQERKLHTILSSEHYEEIFKYYHIKSEVVVKIATSHLGNKWIEFHTSIAEWEDNGTEYDACHILFLTNAGILHLALSDHKFEIAFYYFGKLFLHWRYNTSKNGALTSIEIDVNFIGLFPELVNSEISGFRKEEFKFTKETLLRAQEFLEKYIKLTGG